MKMKIRRLVKEKRAEGYPMAAVVTLALLMMVLAITQFSHLLIIAAGVRDVLQEAVISTVNDNYADVYHAVREGYVAGYQPAYGSFAESVQFGDVYGRLDSLLGLEMDGNYHFRPAAGGRVEYRISDLQVLVSNNGLASGERYSFEAVVSVRLEVPIIFIQKILPDMCITVRTKAAYTPKF